MSKVIRLGALVVVFGLVLSLLAVVPSSDAQDKKGKTRVAQTKNLMKGINGPNCGSAAKLLKAGPSEDKGWNAVAQNAAMLNEASHLLMDGDRCLSGEWAKACATLKGCSAKLAEAAKAKNLDDAKAAFEGVLGACKICHTAHKK